MGYDWGSDLLNKISKKVSWFWVAKLALNIARYFLFAENTSAFPKYDVYFSTNQNSIMVSGDDCVEDIQKIKMVKNLKIRDH